jgi:rod shape-determining protein MreC
MRSLLSKRRLVVGTAAVLFLLSLNLVSSQVRGLAIALSSPLQASLWRAGDGVSAFFGGGSLRRQNEALIQENSVLLAKVVALQDAERENRELREMLQLGLAEEFNMVDAEIIGKSLAQDSIVIRGGQNKGIQKGMPVITAGKAALGRVIESFPTHARVQLISAKESKLDAKIAETQVTGVVRGQGGQELMLDLVPQEDEFLVGDIVLTSNLGDMFPENLLIGKVEEVLKSGENPFQKANVKPFFNLKSTESVFVITSLNL